MIKLSLKVECLFKEDKNEESRMQEAQFVLARANLVQTSIHPDTTETDRQMEEIGIGVSENKIPRGMGWNSGGSHDSRIQSQIRGLTVPEVWSTFRKTFTRPL